MGRPVAQLAAELDKPGVPRLRVRAPGFEQRADLVVGEAPGRDPETIGQVRVGPLVEQALDDRQPMFVTPGFVVARCRAGMQQAALAALAPLGRCAPVEQGEDEVDGAPPGRPANAVVGPGTGFEEQQARVDTAGRTVGARQVQRASIPHRPTVDQRRIVGQELADPRCLAPLAGEEEALLPWCVHRPPDPPRLYAAPTSRAAVADEPDGGVIATLPGRVQERVARVILRIEVEDVQGIRELELEGRPIPRGLSLVPGEQVPPVQQGIDQRILVEPAVGTQLAGRFPASVQTRQTKGPPAIGGIHAPQSRFDTRRVAETRGRFQVGGRAQQIGQAVGAHLQGSVQGRLRGRATRPMGGRSGPHEALDDLLPVPPHGVFQER